LTTGSHYLVGVSGGGRFRGLTYLLKAKASHEIEWINKVDELSGGHFAVIKWSAEDVKDDKPLSST